MSAKKAGGIQDPMLRASVEIEARYHHALGVVVPQWIIAMAKRNDLMDIHMIGDNWRDFVEEDDMMSWNTLTFERRVEIIMAADKKFKDAVNGE